MLLKTCQGTTNTTLLCDIYIDSITYFSDLLFEGGNFEFNSNLTILIIILILIIIITFKIKIQTLKIII